MNDNVLLLAANIVAIIGAGASGLTLAFAALKRRREKGSDSSLEEGTERRGDAAPPLAENNGKANVELEARRLRYRLFTLGVVLLSLTLDLAFAAVWFFLSSVASHALD